MFRVISWRGLAVSAGLVSAACSFGQSNGLGVPVDVTLWGGVTTVDGGGTPRESRSGLRFAEIAFNANANWRYWAKYDNSLTLDNFTFFNKGDTGEAYYLGGQYHVPQRYQFLAEAGIRHLENAIDQTIVRGEYVAFNKNGTHLKLGAWIGDREDNRTEWMAYTGYGFPVSANFRAEPTLFISRSGFGNDQQWRLLLGGDYTLNAGTKINAGMAFGRQKSLGASRDYVGGHVLIEMAMAKSNKAYLLFRRENAGNRNLWNFAMGVTFSLR